MVKVDLITGFLGSGKTTFIKKYAEYLIAKGEKIGILENDYGAVNIDMMLLQDLQGENCNLEMVSGGCDYDCHKRRFKTKLIAMGMSGYNRVIIEPSGVFDIDEFFDVLYESPLDRWYQKGSVIAVVDSKLENELSEQSDYLLATQTASAGKIILSRTQLSSNDEIDNTICHIQNAINKIGCKRNIKNSIISKDWNDFTESDFKEFSESGYKAESYVKMHIAENNAYSSLYYMNTKFSGDELCEIIKAIMKDNTCGNIMRVKGFICEKDGWKEINATTNEIETSYVKNGQEIIIVIGENLCEARINKHFGRA